MACLPLRTMGWRKTLLVLEQLVGLLALVEPFQKRQCVLVLLRSRRPSFAHPPDARQTLSNSPRLMPFSFMSIIWNLMPRSLNHRCAFLVSKLLFVPKIWMFALWPFPPQNIFFSLEYHKNHTLTTYKTGPIV